MYKRALTFTMFHHDKMVLKKIVPIDDGEMTVKALTVLSLNALKTHWTFCRSMLDWNRTFGDNLGANFT